MPILCRDYETRSPLDLRKVGAHKYAADPRTEVLCVAYAVDDGPVQLWLPGDPVPPEFFEAAANPSWAVCAHNDAFESAIEQHVLAPRYGFPIIPLERHRCTMAMCAGARAAGKAERRGRCAGAGEPQGCRRRTADAPDVEAAQAAQRRGSRRAHTGSTIRSGCSGSTPIASKTSRSSASCMIACLRCRPRNRRCGCSAAGSTSAASMSIGNSPRPRAGSPRPRRPRSTPSSPRSPAAPSLQSTRSRGCCSGCSSRAAR